MIEGRTGQWETVIGIEVHAQVVSKAKLFSGAATDFGAEPNTQVSPVDAAFPGMLPVINRFCVEQAVKTGLGLDAEINLHSVFERISRVMPRAASKRRVCCSIFPPSSMSSIWRRASCSIACIT